MQPQGEPAALDVTTVPCLGVVGLATGSADVLGSSAPETEKTQAPIEVSGGCCTAGGPVRLVATPGIGVPGRDEAVDEPPATAVVACSPAQNGIADSPALGGEPTDVDAFLATILVKPSALLPMLEPGTPVRTAPPANAEPPLRSKRIAAHKLAHVPVAKRGEVLIMQKLGYADRAVAVTASAIKRYNSIYHGHLTADHRHAISELFPMATLGRRGSAVIT
ncbi:hypothetical protein BS78_07G044600 [Paspalum vaginatum]|nr:hypothetical protein BS78_07G044600 [Paspalum vaginatum]